MWFIGTASIVAHGQAPHGARPDASPRFETTGVQRARVDDTGMFFNYRAGRFTATNVTLRTLIRAAYSVPESSISEGPSWTHTDRFHVTAIGDVGSSPAPMVVQPTGPSRLQLMMRALLVDHFKLVIHTERRTASVYALRRGPGGRLGPGLRRSVVDCTLEATGGPGASVPTRPRPPDHTCRLSRGPGSIRIDGRPLSQFVSALSAILGRPAVDQTGLTGTFDIDLAWAPEGTPLAVEVSPSAGFDRMSAAILEQLGLLLTPHEEAVDITVIDHVEQPVKD